MKGWLEGVQQMQGKAVEQEERLRLEERIRKQKYSRISIQL
jgi:hypothetical protein